MSPQTAPHSNPQRALCRLSRVLAKTNSRFIRRGDQYVYDAKGNIEKTTRVLSETKTLVENLMYYPDGSLKDSSELHDSTVTAGYPITHIDYDNLGRQVRVEHPDGSLEAWVYDAAGNVALTVNAGGLKATYQYDGANRVSQVADQAGNTSTLTYDAGRNVIAATDANNHTTTAEYDLLHRVTRSQSAVGLVTKKAYDEVGNVKSIKTGDQSIVDAVPDESGQPVTSGYEITAQYYLDNLVREVNEPLPSSSIMLADGTHPASTTTTSNSSYEYDRVGKQTKVTDATGLSTHSHDRVRL